MNKLLRVRYAGDYCYLLTFADGTEGVFDLASYLANRTGPLLDALREEDYAKRAFIDAGALCWPNGLEISARRLVEPELLKRAA